MAQFFVTLPSNSSMNLYPGNRTTQYVTHLATPVKLQGAYEVALMETTFPYTFGGFHEPEVVSLTHTKGPNPPPVSVTLKGDGSVKHIVARINEFVKGVTLSLDNAGTVTITKQPHVKTVEMSPKLASVLGLSEGRAVRPADLRRAFPQQLYIYCDLVESQSVGDTMAPLLRTVNPRVDQYQYGMTCNTSFRVPYYLPVVKREFQSIQILIKDDTGRYPSFDYGTSSCVLHFRPVEHHDF